MSILKSLTNIFSKGYLGSGVTVWPWETPGKWNRRQQLEQFNRYVHSIVSAIASDVAKTQFQMLTLKGDQEEVIKDHELIRLLEMPNPQMSGFQFLELHQVYMELAGEAFWYRVNTSQSGRPRELWLLRPDLMDVLIATDAVGTVEGYEMRLPNGKKQTFKPEEIIHHKLPNPMNPYRGLGVIEAAMAYIQTEGFATDWTKNSIYNSGRPSGIVNLRGNMQDEQFKQVKNRFKQEYSGTKNAGKTMLVRGFEGIDFQKLGMELDGIELEKVKNLSRDDIMIMFRVSKTMLGITDDVNRANAKEAREVWLENVIKPKIERLIDQLDMSVVKPNYDKKQSLWYEDPSPDNLDDKAAEWEKGHNKWLTTNDIRRERGLDPVEGGDVLYQSLSMVPMTDEPMPSGGNTDDDSTPNDDEPGADPADKSATNKVAKKKLNRAERSQIFWKELFDKQEKWQLVYQRAVNRVFNEQERIIIGQATKGLAEWTFDKLESSGLWQRALTPIVIELMVDQAQRAFDFEDYQGELEITPRIRQEIKERIERFSGDVDSETLAQIQDSITEGIAAGESTSKLKKRLVDVYDTAKTVRSERIARTETIFSSNEAALEAYRQIPTVTAQEWFTNYDACEFCQAMNGKIVGLDTDFLKLGQSLTGTTGGTYLVNYENVGHPPLHANCRCTTLPVNIELFKSYLAAQYKTMDKRTAEAKAIKQKMEQL